MNYQYRFGTTMTHAGRFLYQDGGWTRYYQGLTAALVQGPVSRFGDTAAYEGVLSLLDSNPTTAKMPEWIKSAFVSLTAALFRIFLTPIDTVKTTLQAQGSSGMQILRNRVCSYSTTGDMTISVPRSRSMVLGPCGMVLSPLQRRPLLAITQYVSPCLVFPTLITRIVDSYFPLP